MFDGNRVTLDTGWALKTAGSYLIRTNWDESDPRKVWKTYIQLTQVEDAFRVTKSDLGLRPIYHQRADRTQAHMIRVLFLQKKINLVTRITF